MRFAHRVAIVTSEFPPEPTVSGRMAADLATHLADAEAAVTVICPHPSRGVQMPPQTEDPAIQPWIRDGLRIIRVPSYTAPISRFLPRIRESWSFGRASVAALRKLPTPDVVYSATWPMLGQAWITAAAARLKVPHVTHVMDLYPESALLKVSPLLQVSSRSLLLALDRWIARTVSHLAVISEVMRRTYISTRGTDPKRVSVVPTWQDHDPYLTLPSIDEASAAYGIDSGMFSFMYLGNIGPVAGVEHLIKSFGAARIPEAQLLIAGEGSNKAACMQLARDTNAHIQFISDPAICNVPKLQALADVLLLPMRKDAAASSVPSKLSAYMFSAKPVLASVDSNSETARLIELSDCGWVIPPEDSQAMAVAMRECALRKPCVLETLGANGRAYAFKHLTKSNGLELLTELLRQAIISAPHGTRSASTSPAVEAK